MHHNLKFKNPSNINCTEHTHTHTETNSKQIQNKILVDEHTYTTDQSLRIRLVKALNYGNETDILFFCAE